VGLLTYIDRGMLAAYCDAYGRWVDLTVELEGKEVTYKTDRGFVHLNPKVKMAERAKAEMLRLAREFGLTPSGRSSLKIEKADAEPSLADVLFEVVDGKR
jgi:P27 family predicted phage terminase small subunit